MSNHKLFMVGLLAFSLTVVASVTSTYAWFAVSEAGKVSFMDLKINEDHSIKIGLKNNDGEIDYYESINDGILEEHFVSYHAGSALADVSSMYTDLWLNENTNYETAYPILRQSYAADGNIHESYPATQGYYQFEFFFKSDSDMYLFLDYEETKCQALHDENLKYANAYNDGVSDESKKINVKDLDNVVNATRVSFFSSNGYYIYEPNALTSSHTLLGGILDVAPKDGYFDYDSSAMKETVYGEYDESATLVYDDPQTEDSSLSGKESCFNAIHKAGVSRFNYEASVAQGLSIKEEKTYTLEQLGIKSGQGQFDKESMTPIAALKENTPTRVVVTIYLEGWDFDVTEAIGNGKFNLNLGFKGLAAPIGD